MQSMHQPVQLLRVVLRCDYLICHKAMVLTVSNLAHSNSNELVSNTHDNISACSSHICDDCKCYSRLFRSSQLVTDYHSKECHWPLTFTC